MNDQRAQSKRCLKSQDRINVLPQSAATYLNDALRHATIEKILLAVPSAVAAAAWSHWGRERGAQRCSMAAALPWLRIVRHRWTNASTPLTLAIHTHSMDSPPRWPGAPRRAAAQQLCCHADRHSVG